MKNKRYVRGEPKPDERRIATLEYCLAITKEELAQTRAYAEALTEEMVKVLERFGRQKT
jgi:hypothetical protein